MRKTSIKPFTSSSRRSDRCGRVKWLILSLVCLRIIWGGGTCAEGLVYESRLATIHYHDADQLEKFSRKIQPGAIQIWRHELIAQCARDCDSTAASAAAAAAAAAGAEQ